MASQDHGIHSFKEYVPKWSDYLQQTLGRAHIEDEAQAIIREEKMGAIEDQVLTIERRSLKRWGIWRTQILKKILSLLEFG